jgi:hypothetical protein
VISPHVIGFRKGQRVRSKLPSADRWVGTIAQVVVPAEGARYARIVTDHGAAFTELCRNLEEVRDEGDLVVVGCLHAECPHQWKCIGAWRCFYPMHVRSRKAA